MRWLIFLSRVAFLCGIFMALAFALLFIGANREESLFSAIILAGYGLSMVVLPLAGFSYLIAGIWAPKQIKVLPRWLLVSNILFLLIFLFFTFYFNDPYYR